MASPTARITFRVVMVALAVLVLFYMGRPLYWKISATIHEIRENKQTVKQGTLILCFFSFWVLDSSASYSLLQLEMGSGLSQIVLEAQKTVGWYHDESDSGTREDRVAKKVGSATTRRLLFHQVS